LNEHFYISDAGLDVSDLLLGALVTALEFLGRHAIVDHFLQLGFKVQFHRSDKLHLYFLLNQVSQRFRYAARLLLQRQEFSKRVKQIQSFSLESAQLILELFLF
jgi:hypothetical protein